MVNIDRDGNVTDDSAPKDEPEIHRYEWREVPELQIVPTTTEIPERPSWVSIPVPDRFPVRRNEREYEN